METAVRTPRQLFNLSQHLRVPIFQRRYVWQEEHQWQPLWEDIVRTAVMRADGQNVTHFLGAAVLQSRPSGIGELAQWDVIDGQQRITTLQLAMDAVASVFEEMGLTKLKAQLEKMTHNDEVDVDDLDDILKLRHQNDDALAFREVMTALPPVDHEDLETHNSLITQAHAFFARQAQAWLNADPGRAGALCDTLLQGLEVVAITLHSGEDSQEIFETLNARGTPLTASDLIKNFMLQRVLLEGGDTSSSYALHWRPFESKFWEEEVSAGRTTVSRATLFLQQWLISRVGEEVPQHRLFGRFKDYVSHRADASASDLLIQIAQEAAIYRQWVEEAHIEEGTLSQPALSTYRYGETDTEVAKPLMIWMYDPRRRVPEEQRERALAATESWIMRRMLLRLTTADLGRAVAGLISSLESVPLDEVGTWTENYLSRLDSASTYWPPDSEVRETLANLDAYKVFRRSRLRMLLEAVEDDARGFVGHSTAGRAGSRVRRRRMHIEHVLPQSWRRNWPVAQDDFEAQYARERHVHRLGNLTLLTNRLNSSVSNSPWVGAEGKRQALKQHDDNLMTRPLRNEDWAMWDEDQIDRRTDLMVDALLRTWPVPAGHAPRVAGNSDAPQRDVPFAELLASGQLTPGMTLRPRAGTTVAVVTSDGALEVAGERRESPSGAARVVLGRGTNGWRFWLLPDGRSLWDIRAELRSRV